jgi:hypothetical protein
MNIHRAFFYVLEYSATPFSAQWNELRGSPISSQSGFIIRAAVGGWLTTFGCRSQPASFTNDICQ